MAKGFLSRILAKAGITAQVTDTNALLVEKQTGTDVLRVDTLNDTIFAASDVRIDDYSLLGYSSGVFRYQITDTGRFISNVDSTTAVDVGTLTGSQNVFIVDTTNKEVELHNGTDLRVFTDAGTTQVFLVDGATGDVTLAGRIRLQQVADGTAETALATPVEGQLIWRADTNKIRAYDGTAWADVGGGTGSVQVDEASLVIARRVFS